MRRDIRVRAGHCCLAILALIGAHARAHAQEGDTARATYGSPALETFLDEVSRGNARIPEHLEAYKAAVETEMSVVLTDSGGRERTTQLEQIASEVRWRSPSRYDQRVVGYRSQAIGPTFSLMSMFGGWTTPTLYGNRLRLGVVSKGIANAPERGGAASLTLHPLAGNRSAYYTFDGGDTVVVLYSRGRRIPVVVVRVTPRPNLAGDAILFAGDLHIDAARKQLVRMRGRMVEVRGGRASSGSRMFGTSGTTFVELTNVEVDGAYWLPAVQRTEFHARIALLGQFRVVLRVVSRFSDYRVNDSSWTAPASAPGVRHHLTFAPSDSLTRFSNWQWPLGSANAQVHHADFDDVTPGTWRTTSMRALRFRPQAFSEVFRFNRIEGAFTGVALEKSFGDDASGPVARGSLGWAWTEGTARGAFSLEQTRGAWTVGARGQRALAHTNDFELPLSWGATLSALLGSADDFDYLDRRSASVFVARSVGQGGRRSLMRLEVGPASDRPVEPHVSRGLFVEGDGFRQNRGIEAGNYIRTAATLELNPGISGIFVDRGIGVRLHYERADGDLNWQRTELRSAVRRELGVFDLYARGDAGMLFGEPPPQALFELGRGEGLGGYGYKEFAGDRAAMARIVAGYTFTVLGGPIRLPGGFFVPGIAPGLAVGIHGGWTEISNPAAHRALSQLGVIADEAGGALPVSRSTGGVRGSAEVLLTFFSGAVGIGVTRRIDQPGAWQFAWRVGQGF